MSLRTSIVVLSLVSVLLADAHWGPSNWHAVFRPEKPVKGDTSRLKRTFVAAHCDTEIGPGTNLIWCGAFQLAWNEACSLAGGDLRLASLENATVQNPLVEALNRHSFTRDSIDEESYVAMAGLVKEGFYDKISRQVKMKFGFEARLGSAKASTPRAQDFVSYACLYKRLSFPEPFERLDDALRFDGKRVRAFGIGTKETARAAMYSQVEILDFQGPDDFVVQLVTKSKGDRLVLAKVTPKHTLLQTIGTVQERIEGGTAELCQTNDVLMIPKVSLDLVRRFSEIENHWIVPRGGKLPPDLLLRSAVQSIKFDMNEKGVELKSEAHVTGGCSAPAQPARPHIMIFDKPFLVTLARTNTPTPYFALWVDNPEILIPW